MTELHLRSTGQVGPLSDTAPLEVFVESNKENGNRQ